MVISVKPEIGVITRRLALNLHKNGQAISKNLLCEKLGIDNPKDARAVKMAIHRMRNRGELPKLSDSERLAIYIDARKKGAKKRWAQSNTIETVVNRFSGMSKNICKYVVANISRFKEMPVEEVTPTIFKELKDLYPNLTVKLVSIFVSRFRALGFLPHDLVKIRKRLGRRLSEKLYGKNLVVDNIRAKVLELRAEGISDGDITSKKVFDRLGGQNLNFDKFKRLFDYLRRKGEFEKLSEENKATIQRELIAKRKITMQERIFSDYYGNAKLQFKRTKVRAFILAVLEKGFDPKIISVDTVFNELKGKIPNLRRYDVYETIWNLSKEKKLPMTKQAIALQRDLVLKYRKRRAIVDKIIEIIRPTFNGKVGNEELFVAIIRKLMLGTKPEDIVLLLAEDNFKIDIIDVASVAVRTAILVERLADKKILTILTKNKFFDSYLKCRTVLNNYCFRTNKIGTFVEQDRIKRLGLGQK